MAQSASESQRTTAQNFNNRVQELRDLVDKAYTEHLKGTALSFPVHVPDHLTSNEVRAVKREWENQGWTVTQEKNRLYFKNH